MNTFLLKCPKIVLALAVQVVALGILALGVLFAPYFFQPPYSPWGLVLIQALLSLGISRWLGWPVWWLLIQFFLPFGLYLGLTLAFNPTWALLIFGLLWLLFRNAFTERVPLYLTNATTRQALKKMAKEQVGRLDKVRFLDLGCGLGGNVVFMSQQRGVVQSHGVETAPIPYALSKIHSWIGGQGKLSFLKRRFLSQESIETNTVAEVFAQDMWKTDLSRYNLVYAFLSPEPMSKLWLKVISEMPKEAVFISNSFAVPNIDPTSIWQLSDARQTVLYIYRL